MSWDVLFMVAAAFTILITVSLPKGLLRLAIGLISAILGFVALFLTLRM